MRRFYITRVNYLFFCFRSGGGGDSGIATSSFLRFYGMITMKWLSAQNNAQWRR